METVTIASQFSPATRLSPPGSFHSSSAPKRTLCVSPSPTKASLSTTSVVGGSDFAGQSTRPDYVHPSFSSSRRKRDVVTNVIPYKTGRASEQPPPDLASYFFSKRIVYLGMPFVPSVTELIFAEFLYLQYEDREKPVYLYINSTGTTKGGRKLSYETEAFALYDTMTLCKLKVHTLCVGTAWGEAALLLAAGEKGQRAALPSANIMIKQPIGQFQGQAADVEIMRNEMKAVKNKLVALYAKHMGKTREEIEADIQRPKYFSPSEAVEYGIIDSVVDIKGKKKDEDKGVVAELKRNQLI